MGGSIARETGAYPTGRRPGGSWWLVAKNGGRRAGPLVVESNGQRALAVFSFKEEAELFLRYGGLEGRGWRVWESEAGEMASMLRGPCAGVQRVVLDPMPEMLAYEAAGLVSVGRERFLEQLLDRVGSGRLEDDESLLSRNGRDCAVRAAGDD